MQRLEKNLPPYTIIAQARSSSKRLPNKALLPISNYSMVELAVKRASPDLSNIILATSTHESDDKLVELLKQKAIPYIRGSLDDVLSRFILAVKNFDDDHIIVRITADNILPDRLFINELVAKFISSKAEYMSSFNEDLPYGMSAEVFYTRSLREAHQKSQSSHEKEHVTLWIRKNKKTSTFSPQRKVFNSGLRCSVDLISDYSFIQKIFKDISNPLDVPWYEICEKIKNYFHLDFSTTHKPYLTLGAVQLGLPYGIANTSGLPTEKSVYDILSLAKSSHIPFIDTANAYGQSEKRIGNYIRECKTKPFNIITKLAPFDFKNSAISDSDIIHQVTQSVYSSLEALNLPTVDALLLHRYEHLEFQSGIIWETLKKLKNEGLIKSLGVSVQHPEELIKCLDNDSVQFIQMPFNLADWRWKNAEILKKINHKKIFVRSVFLQGALLLEQDKNLPKTQNAQFPKSFLTALNKLAKELKRESVADLCLAYVKGHSFIEGIVLGCETTSQLSDNIELFKNKALSQEEILYVEKSLERIDHTLLNPAEWNKSE